jgi:hypothetical protein
MNMHKSFANVSRMVGASKLLPFCVRNGGPFIVCNLMNRSRGRVGMIRKIGLVRKSWRWSGPRQLDHQLPAGKWNRDLFLSLLINWMSVILEVWKSAWMTIHGNTKIQNEEITFELIPDINKRKGFPTLFQVNRTVSRSLIRVSPDPRLGMSKWSLSGENILVLESQRAEKALAPTLAWAETYPGGESLFPGC